MALTLRKIRLKLVWILILPFLWFVRPTPVLLGVGGRLVFFGRHAGYAGMIDSLSALGGRLTLEGRYGPLTRIMSAWRCRLSNSTVMSIPGLRRMS